jgi:glutamate dehydrogenase
MAATLEHARVDLLDRLCGLATSFVSAGEAPGIDEFIRRYYAEVALDDLESRRVEDLAGAARAHWRLASRRETGAVVVRVGNPAAGTDGWQSPHTVVEIITDDMPFLVDSVTVELERHGLAVQLAVHPVVDVRRDGDGNLLGVANGHVPGGGDGNMLGGADGNMLGGADGNMLGGADGGAGHVITESFLHVEVERTTDPGELASIHDDVVRVLGDVDAATTDWQAMVDKARETADALERDPSPADSAMRDSAVALLRWMADDHFMFTGYRELSCREAQGSDVLTAVPGSGLGILRDRPHPVDGTSFSRLPPELRRRAGDETLLVLTKGNTRSTVHRSAYLDYVGVREFDTQGEVCGERRFVGLYTSEAYHSNPRDIPLLRDKVDAVIARAGFAPRGHSARDLLAILENYPRDELFQATTDELYATAMGILQLEERRRVRLFVRHDPYGRFVSCLVYLPRDRYTTALRLKVTDLLHQAFRATGEDYQALVSESVLARLHIVLRTVPGFVSDVDVDRLEAAVAAASRSWSDDLREVMVEVYGEDRGRALHRVYGDAFPAAYTDETKPGDAISDVACLQRLPARPDLGIRLARTDAAIVLTILGAGAPIVLSDIMPLLQNMGVQVIEERPYTVTPRGGPPAWIERFVLRAIAPGGTLDLDGPAETSFQEAFAAVVVGTVENDSFNGLVLAAGLAWREVAVLRAYSRYLRQAGTPFSQDYIAAALISHPDLARGLIGLFRDRFHPEAAPRDRSESDRRDRQDRQVEELTAALDAVSSLDDDRILRALLRLVLATDRTNAYNDMPGAPVAFKLDPTGVPELPKPLPMFEIFVTSPRVEGVHLRSGRVSRGGIRWSDRREDFRTEILGLMKAQTVKNAVIVPVGAKGGFVVKVPPVEREALAAEVVACYRAFIGALLELTDNLVDGQAVPPAGIVRYDTDDSYLVVAADKGTATFSDIANELALERHYWLGDAFASGGSVGFDHKVMGITARGAWESVKVHFRALGIDVQATPFTAIGIGDMSGDVFGNGMLLSRRLRLVAAFDHRHIFLDPDPDLEASYAERDRLFRLARSSWDDFDRTVLSAGGGVYPRTLKAVPISEPVRAVLQITATTLTPAELISAILRAPVDLLWNGGIGTYVKATTETNFEVGDKTSDGVRIDASQLRCRVVGEGGNLGLTQRARVEFALGGGRINTDAIDNSAGVDTSDHEVNIKILLDGVVRTGRLALDARNTLLGQMTDEVAALVLADNVSQNQTLTIARYQAHSMAGVHRRLMDALAARGRLDRELEFLPDDAALEVRSNTGGGLTVPELAVLLAYSKITLEEDLRETSLLDDPDIQAEIAEYFPTVLRERYSAEMARHPLRRQIIGTRLVNLMVNRAGSTFAFRIAEETGAPADDIVRAHLAAAQIFDEPAIHREIDALDGVVDVDTQCEMHLELRKVVERSSRWLVRYRPRPLSIAATVTELGPGVATCMASMPGLLRGGERDWFESFDTDLRARGVPDLVAARLAGLESLAGALDIVDVAISTGRPVIEILAMWCAVGDRLRLDWLRDRILDDLPRDDRWHALARSALRDDLSNERRALVTTVLAFAPGVGVDDALDRWIAQHPGIAHAMGVLDDLRKVATFDVANLSVALRELRNLSQGDVHR